ncbi:MAG: GatB/YqeY domain-containing protein [Patescibacteria group bacterium]
MIQKSIKDGIMTAMKAKDPLKTEVLRGLTAAFTNELVAKGKKPTDELSDEDALAVIRREVKKRKESVLAFRSGGREESAQKEEAEQALLEAYLPALMRRDDIKKIVDAKKAELNVSDKKDAGRLVGMVMKDLAGKADGGDVKAVVDESFT